MKNYLGIIMSLVWTVILYAQSTTYSTAIKENPIVFAEALFGYAGGSAHGATVGLTVNYQKKQGIYTLRYISQKRLNFEDFFLIIPLLKSDLNIHEFSAMYGKRKVNGGRSFSYSGGLSYNYRIFKDDNINDDFFVGFPFEINIKWFKKEKKRFRAYYGIIPIGKPTSFGRSLGFKLYGNIGKVSYIGLGLNYGFGCHKTY